MKTIENPQLTASKIENYLRDNDLYYGTEPRSNGDASWTIALNNHRITQTQEAYLTKDASLLIRAFHQGSAILLQNSFDPDKRNRRHAFQRLHKYLTAGVTDETQELWVEAAKNKQQIFSTRPDMVIDSSGNFIIIEYNTDGGADKGNTQGVNDYSELFLGEPVLGANLTRLFVQQIREQYQDRDKISVATVLPDAYRKEYDAQNIYFAKVASEIGKKYGVESILKSSDEPEIL